MDGHTIFAIYYHEYIPSSREGDKPIIDYEYMVKYKETLRDAESWAYLQTENFFKEKGYELDVDKIFKYMELHYPIREKSISECLDELIENSNRIKNIESRVKSIEHALGMKNGFARKLGQ